ncbi:hypothetical protein EPUL_006632, partial [Erysiphe pulchra]
FDCMEDFLNTIKRLNDDLTSKEIKLLKQVVIAWVLNNLTSNYEIIVSNIMQNLRSNLDSFTIESLFANLLDESKRQRSLDDNSVNQALVALMKNRSKKSYGGKKPYKISKGKFCRSCQKTNHNTTDCYVLFPNKAPKGWHHFEKPKSLVEVTPKKDQATNQSENEILLSQLEIDPNLTMPEDNMLIDLDFDQVFYCTLDDNKQSANSSLGLIINPSDSSPAEKAIFILDTAATKHIVSDRRYLSNYRSCDKTVRWGNAKSIAISGLGDVYVKFTDSKKIYILKDCLYMPEIGINIISQSELQGDIVSIFHKDKCQIRCNNNIIAKGVKLNSLYHMNIDHIIMPEQVLNIGEAINKRSREKLLPIDVNDLHQRMGHVSPD